MIVLNLNHLLTVYYKSLTDYCNNLLNSKCMTTRQIITWICTKSYLPILKHLPNLTVIELIGKITIKISSARKSWIFQLLERR